jgi:superoxide dismutase, Cu-Zn family
MRIYALLGVILALSGCTSMTMPVRGATSAALPVLVATLRDSAGSTLGTVKIDDGRMTVMGVGMAPGAHGLHIHAVGLCEGPDFKSAAGHWNPDMKQHGRDNPMGAHRGDFPNLIIGADGKGSIAVDLAGDIVSLIDADGSSVIVHAAADDFKTDPSGNSGARLACGVLKPA